jgi:membrane protein
VRPRASEPGGPGRRVHAVSERTDDDIEAPEGVVARGRRRFEAGRAWAERTIFWQVWERMLETEFVDRSVALAGKAFVSFFPLVIVVAAFMPERTRSSIFETLTTRLGVKGQSLDLAKSAFRSSDDVKKATGYLGLLLTFFFASSFTTALQRVYLRSWRRPPGLKVGSYTRGLIWLLALLVNMAATGAVGRALGHGVGLGLFIVVSLVLSVAWWWFSAWYLLLGHVRWRPLLPTAVITAVAMIGYAISANVWMPETVMKNQNQFGIFGIALALVTWFSGAAMCLIVGACAGAVIARHPGRIGRLARGGNDEVLTPGAPPSLGPPTREMRLRDAFSQVADDRADLDAEAARGSDPTA